MKTATKTIAILLLGAGALFAQTAKAKIKSVTVYRGGAVIEQTAKVNLKPGNNNVKIFNIASGLEEKTLIVSAQDGRVVSLNNIRNFTKRAPESPEIKALKDSLKILEKIRRKYSDELKLVDSKIELLKTFSQKGIKTFSKNSYQKIAPFYFKKMSAYLAEKEKTTEKFDKVMNKIGRLRRQLRELNGKRRPVNELRLVINSPRSATSEIKITYLTSRANWEPVYKIISDSLNAPIKIEFGASIKQQTNIDWTEVPVAVSTRKPYLNNNKPRLNPIFIDFYNNPFPMAKRVLSFEKAASPKSRKINKNKQPSATIQKGLMVEFAPKEKLTVPSDNKPRLIKLKSFTLKADYQYYAVPPKSTFAFLVCKIKDWEKLNLIPGMASIYFNNAYVGRSFLNTAVASKFLLISLGRDERIRMERKKVKDFKETNFLGSKITRSIEYLIKVKNNKSKKINLIVEDQIPVSKNEKIVIELQNKDYDSFNPKTGTVNWRVELGAFAEKTIRLKFTIKYPADKKISY